jgi:hypothetical protein
MSYARKVRIWGLAFVAALALSAVVASVAEAAASEFEWASGTTTLERSSNAVQLFNVPGTGSFECHEVLAAATVSGTKAASVTTNKSSLVYRNSATEAECPASLGKAKVTTHECSYQFVAGTSTGTGTSSGTVNIVNCPSTAPIEVNVSGLCLIKISNQTGIGPITYKTNAVSPTTVNIEPHATNIAYSKSGLCGTGSGTNAEYSGSVTVKGKNAGGTQTAVKVIP